MNLNFGYLSSLWAGWRARFIAARRAFENPTDSYQNGVFQHRVAEYDLLWAYYNNSLFDQLAGVWEIYRKSYGLYRNIRSIYNPTTRLVDFYSGTIYPGILSEDGLSLPDGIPSAIPFTKDTSPQLKKAVAQFWQWSNWQTQMSLMTTFGPALGSCFVEVVDDLEHGKVTTDIVWPAFVCDLDLDAAGNVKSYTVEYSTCDDDDDHYLYRKEVDDEKISYYRDGQPYDYTGAGAVATNPYGFVPAVWIKHKSVGSDHGAPAIAGSQGKIDELNNLVSHAHDQIHKVIGAPVVFWTDGRLAPVLDANAKRATTTEFEAPSEEQEKLLWVKGASGGRVDSLAGALSLGDTAPYIDKLLGEIEKSHPELTFYEQLRGMSQVTGPAAQILMGDVASRVLKAMAVYDQASVKIFQMATAIAGFRANTGGWGPSLTTQQQKFLPFDLDSYQRGDLDMVIEPRPIIARTKMELAQEKAAMYNGIAAGVKAGIPLEMVLEDEGWEQDRIDELTKRKDEKAAQQQAIFAAQAGAQPNNQQPGQQGNTNQDQQQQEAA